MTTLLASPPCAGSAARAYTLDQGEDAELLLTTLATFQRPTTVTDAVAQLGKKAKLDPSSAREVIEHLVEGRFLQPA